MAEDTDVLDLSEDMAVIDTEVEDKQSADTPPESDELDGGDEAEIVFGDEVAPASADSETELVKHLRNVAREQSRQLAELRKVQAPAEIQVGEKPTLETCEYDEQRFEQELLDYNSRVAAANAAKTARQSVEQEQSEKQAAKVQAFQVGLAVLPYKDKDHAVENARLALNDVQQAVALRVLREPAKVIYALGKLPGKLAEVSAIQDPFELAAALGKLEGQIKVNPKRATPQPERIANGSGTSRAGSDKELERLEREAESSGNYDKLFAYKRAMKAK